MPQKKSVGIMGRKSETPAKADAPAPDAPIGRKCGQLMDGARRVIFARGLEGASVDDIAREAGISKATMYRYFPDKASLFAAMMREDCASQAAGLLDIRTGGLPPRTVLTDLATRYIGFVASPFALSIYRITASEAERFPEVARAFHASAMQRGQDWLAGYLREAMARGEVSVEDPDLAARQFFALCQADVFHPRLLGIAPEPDAQQVAAHARSAVTAFLRLADARAETSA